MKTVSLLLAALVLSAAGAARADDASDPSAPSAPAADDVARLRENLDGEREARTQLETRIAEIEKRERERLVVSGYVHLDWVALRQSSQDEVTQDGAPLNEDRFVLRRARLRAERDHGLFHGAFEIDANTVAGPQLRPIDAEASLKWPSRRPYARAPWAHDTAGAPSESVDGPDRAPRIEDERRRAQARTDEPWFMVTAGLFRTPFGFEVQESERQRPWLERATVSSALFPQSFDLGVRVAGGFAFVRYAIGIMNGDPVGERTFPGRDPNKSKDLTFRLGGATAVTDRIRLEGGVSGMTGRGFSPGQPATKDVLQWQDSNDDGVIDATELQISAGSPATPSQGFRRFAMGADVRVVVGLPVLGDLALRAEIVRAQNLDRGLMVSDPIVATRDLRQLGWYVGASQELTPWALIGVRYDRYDPDADAREQTPFAIVPRDPSMSTWSFSAAARAAFARLVAQYDHRKNAFGRDASGAPVTLADDSFTLRAEVRF